MGLGNFFSKAVSLLLSPFSSDHHTTQKTDPNSIKSLQPLEDEANHQTHPGSYENPPITGLLEPRDISSSPDVAISKTGDTSLTPTTREPNPTVASLKAQLNDEKKWRAKAENELVQVQNKLKAIHFKWKKAASELDKVLSRTRAFNQVTDEELKEMALQLRYNIRNFAIQYFSEPSSRSLREIRGNKYDDCMPEYCELYLKQPEQYPLLVEHFLWRVLADHVFDRFLWAGASSQGLNDLWDLFAYSNGDESQDSQTTVSTTQKIYTWRATTTRMILECPREKDTLCNLGMRERVINDVQLILGSLSDEDYDNELHNILGAAIRMDQVICSQVANVFWEFQNSLDTEQDQGPELPENGDIVVVCPAMVKRGKSNGEDFEHESVLLAGGKGFFRRY